MVAAGNVIIASFAAWSIYEQNYNVWDIDAGRITHINYSFANIKDGKVTLGDQWADKDAKFPGHGDSDTDSDEDDPGERRLGNLKLHGNLHQLYLLKQTHRHLKVGLSIGGWDWSRDFSDVCATASSRSKFVISALAIMQAVGMDYIDLDWEYPISGGLPHNSNRPDDGENFVLLLEDLHREYRRITGRRLNLTAAIPCSSDHYGNFKLAEMVPHLDYFNVMCYDFSGPWPSVTKADHHSNLYARDRSIYTLSVDNAIRDIMSIGVPPEKIVLGLPFYGRGFANCSGLQQSFEHDVEGNWGMPGWYDYKNLPLDNCTVLWEEASKASFCYNPVKRHFISYDTPTSISHKMRYIRENGLAGVKFWELSADLPTTHPKSLLRNIHNWLKENLDTSQNELCYPLSPFINIKNGSPDICPQEQLPPPPSLTVVTATTSSAAGTPTLAQAISISNVKPLPPPLVPPGLARQNTPAAVATPPIIPPLQKPQKVQRARPAKVILTNK